MKTRYFAAAAAFLLLTACGNTKTVDQLAAQQAEPAAQVQADVQASEGSLPESLSNVEYDVDLTQMNSNMIYAQVYDMLENTEKYAGQMIRVQGTFNYYQDPESKREYFAALVSDATACCAQGIEFVRKDGAHYPEDYPEQGTPIEISGKFSTYTEDNQVFVELQDATMIVL
ncbi:MAG: hypothetical protein J5722_01020 [Oscillospiraceae bacterium]|nr:hypothetical protein [Oscillospiraceae bacterium]